MIVDQNTVALATLKQRISTEGMNPQLMQQATAHFEAAHPSYMLLLRAVQGWLYMAPEHASLEYLRG